MINRERMVQNFCRLAGISSVSGHEYQLVMMIDQILDRLFSRAGLHCQYDDANKDMKNFGIGTGNMILDLRATFGNENLEPIGFVAHLDTVDDEGIRIVPIVKGEIIQNGNKGILGADDKAGIAVIIEMLYLLHEYKIPHGPIVVVLTIGEESGMQGSLNIDLEKLHGCRQFYIFDGDDPLKVYRGGIGKDKYTVTFHGVAAHAGLNPQDGRSAILAACQAGQQIAARNLHGEIMKDELWHNISSISGGTVTSTNIVPKECQFSGETRFWDAGKGTRFFDELSFIFAEIANQCGCTSHVEAKRPYFPVLLPENHPLVIRALEVIEKVTGMPARIDKMPGGSDANGLHMASKGKIESVILGCGMRKPHSDEEYLVLDEFFQATNIALLLATSDK